MEQREPGAGQSKEKRFVWKPVPTLQELDAELFESPVFGTIIHVLRFQRNQYRRSGPHSIKFARRGIPQDRTSVNAQKGLHRPESRDRHHRERTGVLLPNGEATAISPKPGPAIGLHPIDGNPLDRTAESANVAAFGSDGLAGGATRAGVAGIGIDQDGSVRTMRGEGLTVPNGPVIQIGQ